MKLKKIALTQPGIRVCLLWPFLTFACAVIDVKIQSENGVPMLDSSEIHAPSKLYFEHPYLPNKETLQNCVCSFNGQQKLCGSSSCPCKKYSGEICMTKVCSCLNYGSCRTFFHPETGYSCPCLGDRTGFNCSVVDHRPTCEESLVLSATDSPTKQRLTCFPRNGADPGSPCIDREDNLIYTLAEKKNVSSSFTLRSESNRTCLWFQKDGIKTEYTVFIIATEMDEVYSRPNRSDSFEVRVSLKAGLNQPLRFTNLTPTFLQFNFDNHPLQKGINFSLKATDTHVGQEGRITYKLLDVLPKSFVEFVHLDSLTGNVLFLKPQNPIKTRQIVNIRVKAVDVNFPSMSAVIPTKLNLIFSPPLCQTTEPVWFYTSARYDHSGVANLTCSHNTGLGPFTFLVNRNSSGLHFMTKGSQLLASGKPPYPKGIYSLRLNVQDQFGDLGTANIPYVIAPAPDLQVRILNFTTVEVSWLFSPPEITKAYKLNISETKQVYSFDFTGSTYKQHINNLHPMKNYSFQMFAKVGNHQTLVPSNVFVITMPKNVSAVCTPMYNGSYPSSDSALRCGSIFMRCRDPGQPNTRNLVYQFTGSFAHLSVKNVTCLDDKCLFCFPKNSEGHYQLDINVGNQRLDIKYTLPIHLHVPKPPDCESKTDFFNVSELAQRDSMVGQIKFKNPPESETLQLAILGPVERLRYFYIGRNGDIRIRDSIDQLGNMDITLNLLVSNRVGHCTLDITIHVIDENETPSCNFPHVVHLMHPIVKGTEILNLNCTDPDISKGNNQLTISLQPDPHFETPMFEVLSEKTIYAKRDIPLNVLAYNLKVEVQDSSQSSPHHIYPLKLLINGTLIQKFTVSFKITSIPRNNAFSDPNSDAYQKFVRIFTDSISKIFLPLKGFLRSKFLEIRPGTTIIDVVITFDKYAQLPLVKTAYISAVKNGFSNFSFDPNYIEISVPNHHDSIFIEKALQVSSLACVGCDVTYMCCTQPYDKKLSFHWFFNGIPINNYSDKMELVGLRKWCDSCSGQSQCLTVRPITDSFNSTLTCEVTTLNKPTDYVVFDVLPVKPPQVMLNSSSQYFFTGLQKEFIICSLNKPQDSLPINFKWFLDSVPLNNKDADFQLEKLSAFSEALYIKELTRFHHISCKVCFGEGVPCSQSNLFFNLEKAAHFCPFDLDSQGRIWPETLAGKNQTIPCPENTTGNIVRMCDSLGHWKMPSQEDCVDTSIWEIFSKLHNMKFSKTSMNKQASLMLESFSKITAQPKTLQNSKSLEIGTRALNVFTEISKSSSNKISHTDAMNFYRTASNLLSTKHKKMWDILNAKNKGVPKLMKVIGDFGNSIVNNLDNIVDDPVFQTKNIRVQIGWTRSKGIIFPKLESGSNSLMGKTNVIIPGKTLESFLSVNETVGYTAIHYRQLAVLLTNEPISSFRINQTLKKEKLNSDVLAVTLATKIPAHLDPPVQLTFQHLQKNMKNPLCSFWDFNSNTSLMGSWSTNGCRIKYTDNEMTICNCDHLTNFAVLMYPVKTPPLHSKVLSYITIIGCSLSILGCLLTIAAYAGLWRYMRRRRATVLIHLCISLIIADIIFLAGVEQTSSKAWCTSIAVVLHYFYLVVFFNMLAEGLDMAVSVTYVFATKSRTSYLLPMAWGIPAVIVGITMAITRLKGYGNSRFCWLSFEDGTIWAFVAPAVLIMAINLVVIILVFRAMFSTSSMLRKSVEEKAKSGAHGACVLLPVLGLTWMFGIFSVNKPTIIFQYLFALFNSMQGLLIFVFHCILNKQIRDAFWKKTSHLTSSSRTSSRSSPRYHETAKRLSSGLPSKTIEQGLKRSKKNKNGKKVWSTTTDHKPVNQTSSLNVLLQCPVIYDLKEDLQSDQYNENKDSVQSQEPRTTKEGTQTEQRTVKFESMDKNQEIQKATILNRTKSSRIHSF